MRPSISSWIGGSTFSWPMATRRSSSGEGTLISDKEELRLLVDPLDESVARSLPFPLGSLEQGRLGRTSHRDRSYPLRPCSIVGRLQAYARAEADKLRPLVIRRGYECVAADAAGLAIVRVTRGPGLLVFRMKYARGRHESLPDPSGVEWISGPIRSGAGAEPVPSEREARRGADHLPYVTPSGSGSGYRSIH